MIAKHSCEQSQKGEGVEVVENRPHEDPEHGTGQYTEKRIHLSSKLPSWIRYTVTWGRFVQQCTVSSDASEGFLGSMSYSILSPRFSSKFS